MPARIGERARQLASTEEGRAELVHLLIEGTPASSAERRRPHPTYAELSDQDLKALLNFMLYQETSADAARPARPEAYAVGEVTQLRAPDAESPAEDEPR